LKIGHGKNIMTPEKALKLTEVGFIFDCRELRGKSPKLADKSN